MIVQVITNVTRICYATKDLDMKWCPAARDRALTSIITALIQQMSLAINQKMVVEEEEEEEEGKMMPGVLEEEEEEKIMPEEEGVVASLIRLFISTFMFVVLLAG